MKKTILYWEKFRANDYLFQLKIMGIVFRHGIPVYIEADPLDWTGTHEWDKIPFMERSGQPVAC
jgi:hypothetical protein